MIEVWNSTKARAKQSASISSLKNSRPKYVWLDAHVVIIVNRPMIGWKRKVCIRNALFAFNGVLWWWYFDKDTLFGICIVLTVCTPVQWNLKTVKLLTILQTRIVIERMKSNNRNELTHFRFAVGISFTSPCSVRSLCSLCVCWVCSGALGSCALDGFKLHYRSVSLLSCSLTFHSLVVGFSGLSL